MLNFVILIYVKKYKLVTNDILCETWIAVSKHFVINGFKDSV